MLGEQQRAVSVIVDLDEQGNAITEQRVINATRLGQLQNQQLKLSREGQRIQFDIAQRQINFNSALAQIEVPGATPAEMAARVANAKLLAREEQERLNRERQMFNIGVEIEDIGISRAAEDFLNITLPEMFQGRAVQLEISGLQAATEEAQKAQGAISAFVDSFVGEQAAVQQALHDAWLATKTEMNAFEEIYRDTIDQGLADLSERYGAFLRGEPLPTTYSTTAPDIAAPNRGRPTPPGWNDTPAGGDLGGTITATRSASVVIQFNGDVNVRDESDIDKIARRVEQAMNRRAISVGVGM
jgi:hypothetical protein